MSKSSRRRPAYYVHAPRIKRGRRTKYDLEAVRIAFRIVALPAARSKHTDAEKDSIIIDALKQSRLSETKFARLWELLYAEYEAQCLRFFDLMVLSPHMETTNFLAAQTAIQNGEPLPESHVVTLKDLLGSEPTTPDAARAALFAYIEKLEKER